ADGDFSPIEREQLLHNGRRSSGIQPIKVSRGRELSGRANGLQRHSAVGPSLAKAAGASGDRTTRVWSRGSASARDRSKPFASPQSLRSATVAKQTDRTLLFPGICCAPPCGLT